MNIEWNLLIENCKKEVHSLGYEWIDFVQTGIQKKTNLKFFIDKRVGGFTIDDATFLTKKLVHWFTEQLPEETNFQIEVSSPGIDRPIKELWQFSKHLGRVLTVQFEENSIIIEKSGILKSATEELLVLGTEHNEVNIPMSSVKKGNVLVSFMSDRNKGKRR